MELLDVVDENGIPTGETVEREKAHREGIRHRTSHVWIARVKDGKVELLLQRRSLNKDSHPGCLDISSAGHITAGTGYVESAIRELEEELGIIVEASELHFCGKKRRAYKKHFHGHEFFDNQVSNVYVMARDVDIEEIVCQESEICEVLWMPFDEVYSMVEEDEVNIRNEGENAAIKSCITLDEMDMIRNYIKDHFEQIVCELGLHTSNNTKQVRLTTLCYIEQDGKYLMLYRNKKENDQSEGKWLGVGGKLEDGESPEECAVREVYEETGLVLEAVKFRGIVTFVSDIWENELMFLFTSDKFSGEVKTVCDEGELEWISKDKVLALPAWEGDRHFLKPLLDGEDDIHIKLIYQGDRLVEVVNSAKM